MSSLGVNFRPRKRSSVSLPHFNTPIIVEEQESDLSTSSAIEDNSLESISIPTISTTPPSPPSTTMNKSSLSPLDDEDKFHRRKRSSFSYPYPSNNEGSWSLKSKTVSFDSDKATTYIGILAFCLLTLYIISGLIWNNHDNYIPIIADSSHVEVTNDPIIIPKLDDLGMFKTKGVPKRAPNDNAKEVIEKPDSSVNINARPNPGLVTSYVYDAGKNGPSPSVIVVMGIDYEKYKPDYLTKIIENRVEYAKAHGYGTYMRFVQDFKSVYTDTLSANPTWAKIPIMRAALLAFPKAKYFWYLDESALIMNPLIDIEHEFINPKNLESKLQRGVPVVKKADYIKTYKFTKAEAFKMVITQDDVGLNPTSFILHNSHYAVSLLEFWSDRLYRQYKLFQTESQALNHLSQWHPTFLSKVAVVPARDLCSYAPTSSLVKTEPKFAYSDGDFVVNLDCDPHVKACNDLFQRFWRGRGRVNL